MILNDLPEKHPLRNTPIGKLQAKYRWKKASEKAQWRSVEVGSPKLVDKTFNQLSEAWTKWDWWVAEDWDEKRIDIIGSNGNEGLHYEI